MTLLTSCILANPSVPSFYAKLGRAERFAVYFEVTRLKLDRPPEMVLLPDKVINWL